MQELDPAAGVPPPTATGVLSERPLAHLLAFAQQRSISGTFELANPPDQFARIVVDQGLISRVWLSEEAYFLGQILFEGGVLTEEQLSDTLSEVAATSELTGQVLLQTGLVTPENLDMALAYQRARKLHHVFSFPESTQFAFYDDVDLVGALVNDPAPCDPLPSIWRGIAAAPAWTHVNTAVTAAAGRPVRLVKQFDMSSLREVERAALESLWQWPTNAEGLASRPGIEPHVAQLIIYFLLITHIGEVDERAGASIPAPAPPPAATRNPAARASGLPPPVRKISIGVPNPPDSAPASVRPQATSQRPAPVSARPAPPAPAEMSPIEALLAGIPLPTTGASLFEPTPPPSGSSLPAEGNALDAILGGGSESTSASPSIRPAGAPEIEKNPEAVRALEDAEMQWVLGERPEALRLVRKALEIMPKWPDGLSLFAALEASTVKKGEEHKLKEIIKRMDSLISRDPNVRRGRFYRAQMKRRMGDLAGALDDLRDFVAQDPEDADARREMRVVEKLLETGKKGVAGSFLDRLRGK
jgi:hypothetical protein